MFVPFLARVSWRDFSPRCGELTFQDSSQRTLQSSLTWIWGWLLMSCSQLEGNDDLYWRGFPCLSPRSFSVLSRMSCRASQLARRCIVKLLGYRQTTWRPEVRLWETVRLSHVNIFLFTCKFGNSDTRLWPARPCHDWCWCCGCKLPLCVAIPPWYEEYERSYYRFPLLFCKRDSGSTVSPLFCASAESVVVASCAVCAVHKMYRFTLVFRPA